MQKSKEIDMDYVRDLYNNMENIWPADDLWYTYTHNKIVNYVNNYININNFTKQSRILNVGSGGNTYNIPGIQYHTDIAFEKIKNIPNSYFASAESLPFLDNFFDGGICVGSVINYCDPYKVIGEISRTLKPNTTFVLDFEQSRSFQFINTSAFNSDATIIHSFNSGNDDMVWVFSEKYICNTAKSFGLKIKTKQYFHILSPLLYKITKDEQYAAKFSVYDKYLKYIPFINHVSCNIILTMQKV